MIKKKEAGMVEEKPKIVKPIEQPSPIKPEVTIVAKTAQPQRRYKVIVSSSGEGELSVNVEHFLAMHPGAQLFGGAMYCDRLSIWHQTLSGNWL